MRQRLRRRAHDLARPRSSSAGVHACRPPRRRTRAPACPRGAPCSVWSRAPCTLRRVRRRSHQPAHDGHAGEPGTSVPSRSGSATTPSMPAASSSATAPASAWCRAPRARDEQRRASARPRQPQPTIRTRATRLGGRAASLAARGRRSSSRQRSSRRHLGADVVLGDLGAAARAAAARSGPRSSGPRRRSRARPRPRASGWAPVHLLGARARIPAPERQEDPDARPARRTRRMPRTRPRAAECTLPPHAGRRDPRRPAHADRPLRRACSRPSGPTTSPPASIARGRRAQRADPGDDRRGLHGLHQPGGRGQPQRRADGVAARRACRSRSRA